MGKTLRVITLFSVLIIAALACQPFQTTANQGPAPISADASPPPTIAPLALPTIIEETATSTPLALPQESGQVFIDDFSNRNSGWSYEYSDLVDWDYYQGGYRVSVREFDTIAINTLDGNYKNVRIVADVRRIGGEEQNLFGLICRSQSEADTYYAAVISSTGFFAIGRRIQGGDVEFISSADSPHSVVINQGMDLNLIEMSCVEDRISLTVNGVLLVEVYDSSIPDGTVGMFVYTVFTHSSDILFDNFHLYLEE